MGGAGVPEIGKALPNRPLQDLRHSGILPLRHRCRRSQILQSDNRLRRFLPFGPFCGAGASAGDCQRPRKLSQEVTP